MYIHPEYQKPAKPRPIMLPLLIWLSVILGLIAILAALPGCASTDAAKVCYMKAMGMTEEGYTVAVVQCMTPEAFAESQK